MAIQLGLRIYEAPVSGNIGAWEKWRQQSVWDICWDLLGAVPEERCAVLDPGLLVDVDSGFLCPDKSSSCVHLKWLPLLRDFGEAGSYRWGSAALACLYHSLCRGVKHPVVDIAGCAALLLSWAYYRIPDLHPRHDRGITFPLASRWEGLRIPSNGDARRLVDFRVRLDSIPINGFQWTPYEDANVVAVTPTHVYAGAGSWASIIALLCFEIVHPDRAMRQFQMQQPIPHAPVNIDKLHAIDGWGNDKVW